MLCKNQCLQLKVLIKTRVRQVEQLLNHGNVEPFNEPAFRQEINNLQNNLQRLNDGSISTCKQCGQSIDYTHLIARPDTTYCELCDNQ